jgi:hypothetical protein
VPYIPSFDVAGPFRTPAPGHIPSGRPSGACQAGGVREEPLPGGLVTGPVRVGDTIRRRPPRDAAYNRALLHWLAARGWPGAPRFLGTDHQGRDILSFIGGHAAWAPSQPSAVTSDASLARAAILVRELHDLTAGTPLAAGAEVACHNDLSPANTVYRDDGAGLRPVAFIDWDLAAPGARIHDVAHLCWQFLGLGPDVTDVAEAGRRMRLICDTYGLADRSALPGTNTRWQDRCYRGIEAQAAAGDPAMIALCDTGAPAAIRAERAWTARHQADLATFLA